MINSLIKKQLEKLQLATPGNYDDIKHQYVFKKITSNEFEVDKCYLIRLDKSLLTESINDSLIYNLNRGTFPKYEYMKVDVLKIKQSLIQVNGVYYDVITNQNINEFWSGWLPLNQLEIIKEI